MLNNNLPPPPASIPQEIPDTTLDDLTRIYLAGLTLLGLYIVFKVID